MKNFTSILFAVLLCAVPAMAQDVSVSSFRSVRAGDRMDIEFAVNYGNADITPRQELKITPCVVKGRDTMRLSPIVVEGKIFNAKEERKEALYGDNQVETPYKAVTLSRKELRQLSGDDAEPSTVYYRATLPYQSWMDNSDVILECGIMGCRGKSEKYYTGVGALYNPVSPQVAFITPAYEVQKVRHEQMTARVKFLVDKYDINRSIYDNANELDRIYEFTENIVADENSTITRINLTGYASPEAPYTYNDRLSRNRAGALRDLLSKKYGIAQSMFNINNVPEDWDSLSNWISKSTLSNRNELLGIIRTTPDPDQRDAKIKGLDNGATYNKLLSEAYPLLRRVEYAIEYTVTPFTVEKGKEVLRTKPRNLSLYEFYQIAGTYQTGSAEYRNVLATAVHYFPEDPVANSNMAAMAILDGDLDAARHYIQKAGNSAQAQNNAGIIDALEGRYDQADANFRRAAEAGSKEASFNSEHIYSLR